MNGFHRSGPDGRDPTVVETAHFLEQDPYVFDAPFFHVSPVEAASMDPQQRLLLETVYEALEGAGLPLETLQGSLTGVFCGYMNQDHGLIHHTDRDRVMPFISSGSSSAIHSNRISYFFDWRGPSMTLDTACSASLTAVHLAFNALQTEDCSLAVCAGSNLMLDPNTFQNMTEMQVLSHTGRSHMWDERADGYARGEGVAAVILKPLKDALRDGDRIECLIRATGANSDGRTQGLTVPNGKAQLDLIRQTYARAGLNPLSPDGRCQYFEAHGTGTPAGDPQEAYSISRAFFNEDSAPDDILQVGSIKTVVGHTEATAGVAGVIKGSLAIQNGWIPPNLHFQKPNPAVAQHMAHLRVPVQPLPWPELPAGVPRRVSINSFGFGGANAHVILESFDPSPPANTSNLTRPPVLPFVFSAASPESLNAVLQRHLAFLDAHPGTDMVDLAGSLIMRRSALPYRLALVAGSVDGLRQKLQSELGQQHGINSPSTISRGPGGGSEQILGVFTGQGAQYAQMGRDVILNSPQARSWLAGLQESLDSLPAQYKPSFSLLDELLASEDSSRIHTGEISQPLRTALQIIHVNILRALGISFAAVVGHSSGEIAAAYAAGRLGAHDAIRVAHLRGLASTNAGRDGRTGGMMAVSISWEQAQAICAEEPYAGNVFISASNSPSSVTLSGDADLLQELEWLFRSLDQNPRRLQVDTAYHSSHMEPCAEPYMRAMKAAQVQTSPANASTKWFSSVFDGQLMDSLNIDYWKDNMLRPVLFSQAVTNALAQLPNISAIVEIGPHPALQGPTTQTVSQSQPEKVDTPYIAVCRRKESALETLAEAVGSFWTYFGAQLLDIPAYVQLFLPGHSAIASIRDLPVYPWDHRKPYKSFSRAAAVGLHRPNPIHPLLGALSVECGEGEWRWRNYLRLQNIDWLEDHQVQSQVIFPATGYLVLAHEAARIIANGHALQYVEIRGVTIDRAITIPDDASGTEMLFVVNIGPSEDRSVLSGRFSCQAAFGDELQCCCSGQIRITLGDVDPDLLAAKDPDLPSLRPVDANQLYQELAFLGYEYNGVFRGLNDIWRRKNVASGLITPVNRDRLLLHPATLDMGLQSLMVAIGAPGDAQLTDIYVPTRIARATINSGLCPTVSQQDPMRVQCLITAMGLGGTSGDIDLFDSNRNGIVQIEGVSIAPLNPAMAADNQFREIVWGPLHLNTGGHVPEIASIAVAEALAKLEHTFLLILQEIQTRLTPEDRAQLDPLRSKYVAWIDRVLSLTRAGEHPSMRPEYLQDDIEFIHKGLKGIDKVFFRVIEVFRRKVIPWLRGQASIMEALREDNLLDQLYAENRLDANVTRRLGETVQRLAFRYPHMKILEVGAGTGSATRQILPRLAGQYHSYTYTDISAAFFEKATEEFSQRNGDQIIPQILDIERDPMAQGFPERGYDLVVASNVLHATRSLHTTMGNVRRLLKPGGRVAIMEITNPDVLVIGGIFGCFEGWWLGEQDGRPWGPIINVPRWEKLLQESGFTKLEMISDTAMNGIDYNSVMMTRVADERLQRIQAPFSVAPSAQYADLLIVGGLSTASAPLVQTLKAHLGPYFQCTTHFESFEAVEPVSNLHAAVVLVFSDLDSPYMEKITAAKLQGLQRIFPVTSKMLWITPECESAGPYLNMSRAVLASVRYEYPKALIQHLTVADTAMISPELVATSLLRLAHADVKNDFRQTDLLETVETELRLEKDGMVKIPRLQTIPALNLRLQSSRGLSSEIVNPRVSCVQIRTNVKENGESPSHLVSAPAPSEAIDNSGNTVLLRVHYATLPAIRMAATCFLYVVVGQEIKTGERMLALAHENASFVCTRRSWTSSVPASIQGGDEAMYVKNISAALVSEYLIQQAPSSSTILIHEPEMVSESFRSFVTALAFTKDVHVRFCVSSSMPSSNPDLWCISPGISTRALSRQLPANLSMVATFGARSDAVFGKLRALLQPLGVLHLSADDIYQTRSIDVPEKQAHAISNLLAAASHIVGDSMTSHAFPNTVQPDQLPNHLDAALGLDIVDWDHTGPIPAYPLSASDLVRLSGLKSYLLVGMTGEMGMSIAQWMIERGAGFVVLTSRTPKVDAQWIDEMARLGGQVLVLPM